MTDLIETKVFREPWDVDRRLNELDLTRAGLLAVRDIAVAERANATDFHPANTLGTLAYHHGTWALREFFVGKKWHADRSEGIEAIRNDELKIRVALCNVDLTCDDNHTPKPCTEKGAGAERASNPSLFPDLPQYAPRLSEDWKLYYLMVDQAGAAELTRPVVSGGKFTAPIERIYLSDGGDDDLVERTEPDSGPVGDFDPQVVRK